MAVYDHQHQRRRKTLFFLDDERAFPGAEQFLVELQEIVQLWEQRRGQPRATV
ncbi:hypothetical protein O7626_19745 [Micromonospora sp. WMMD1102]|uniref:hypothetical protein n=1 Tax=Micromonospora sp. WMMD1102 TaxID=3016105 RepID=UPI0024154BAB|nr:hypothetical protein [Micromonospora sp. WMMD1102]MDG4788142.1 hypothetical protein [Micromonospora sp. WMMD1102]